MGSKKEKHNKNNKKTKQQQWPKRKNLVCFHYLDCRYHQVAKAGGFGVLQVISLCECLDEIIERISGPRSLSQKAEQQSSVKKGCVHHSSSSFEAPGFLVPALPGLLGFLKAGWKRKRLKPPGKKKGMKFCTYPSSPRASWGEAPRR